MNTRSVSKFIYTGFSFLLILSLYSCSGGSSTPTTGGRGGSSPGILTVSITDAAIDDASEVWVQFTGISVKPANGSAIDFSFDSAKNINLLDLQGTRFTDLISNTVIPAGSYNWIRLDVNASNDGTNDTYIVLNDGSVHELWIPSGEQSGLKINQKFEIIANEQLNLILDFDLRKSIILQANSYKLRPSLRMVKKRNTDNITGTIEPSLLTAANCSDTDPSTGNAVYLYSGTAVLPSDINNNNQGPETSARIKLNQQTGNYEYTIGYVPAGNYTLAFTCQANMDNPDTRDNITFSFTTNLTITVNLSDLNLPVILPDAVR